MKLLLEYLQGSAVSAERISIHWLPIIKHKCADPMSRATRFFTERFGFVHGKTVDVYEFLTKDLKKKKHSSLEKKKKNDNNNK